VAVLDQEVGVKPSEETRDLYEQLMRGEKPPIASIADDVQHVPPDIFPVDSPAFLMRRQRRWQTKKVHSSVESVS
jgi:hypothetical protein